MEDGIQSLVPQNVHAVLRAYQQTSNQPSGAARSQASTMPATPATPGTPATPTPGPTPASLSSDQLTALKYQILAFKLISKNLPVPPNLQQAMFTPGATLTSLAAQDIAASNVTSKVVEAAFNHRSASTSTPTNSSTDANAQLTVQSQAQLGPPTFNSYTNPHTYLKKPFSATAGSRFQRLLIPSITPVGLDAYELAHERERMIQTRINFRIAELENLPADMTNVSMKLEGEEKENAQVDIKLKASIELKALRLREKQRQVRMEILKGMSKATLATTVDRAAYRRMKKQSLREARITEKLERQQRVERERREKQKHLDYLLSVCNHGRDMLAWHRTQQGKQAKLGRAVLNYHAQIAKEAERREHQKANERLRALKNNDEVAYRKLVDEAKDTRITHLLNQTNAYLESLTQAVVAQQNDELHKDPAWRSITDESMDFGEPENLQGKDYYAVAHRIKEKVEQPSILEGGTLKEYQVKGLEWMVSLYNNRLNGILADEMGLGKTIQTISLITYLIEKKKQNGPFLIVVPLSTLTNWTLEFDKWAPSVTKCVYKGTPSVRKSLQNDYIKHENFQVLLTTYEYIIKDKPALGKIRWAYMIIDEGHRMKNVNSKLSMILTNNYQSRYRLILTGTPLQNNLPELWSLLNFVLPKIFNSVKSFDEWFNTPFANTGGQDKIALNEEETLLVIQRLHKVLRPFLLRRLKKDVEAELPEKVERVLRCKFSALQLRLYNQMKKHGMLFVNTGEKGKTGIKGLNNTIMQLRKICNHPFVFEEVEKDINPGRTTNILIYRVSGKFELLDRILPKLFRTGHRVLIFFQMTAIMNIMEDYLYMRGFKYLRLDGATKAEDRSVLLKQFNDPGSDRFVFLLSTRAGGLGLNLQTADTVIIFDSDWNPHQDLQAQDRAHRIGQTKEVRILRLVTQKSIEETILARAQYKLDIDGKVIQAGKFDNKSTAEERDAFLRSLLENELEEANDVDEDEDLDDDELNEILARDDRERVLFRDIDRERQKQDEIEWKARGRPGKKVERLIQECELPDIYLKDEEMLFRQQEEHTEYGRGQRRREDVHYDDGLTEEQWLNAIEDDDADLTEVIAKKQEAKRRREEKKRQKLETKHKGQPHVEGSVASTPQKLNGEETSNTDVPETPKKKRGRPRKEPVSPEETGATSESQKGRKKKSKKKADAPEDDEEPKPKKRRIKKGPDESSGPDKVPESIRRKMNDIFYQCYEAVDKCVDESGEGEPRQRAYLFLELPSKKVYPQYYIMIKRPIAMDIIKKRIKKIYYQTLTQFREDWLLMFQNAREFNEEGSMVYEDANVLEAMFNEKFMELAPEGGEFSYLPMDVDEE